MGYDSKTKKMSNLCDKRNTRKLADAPQVPPGKHAKPCL